MGDVRNYLSVYDVPIYFKIKRGYESRVFNKFQFGRLDIRTLLFYGAYLGIKDKHQRTFALLLMRQLPRIQTQQGYIELDIECNCLMLYLCDVFPIKLAKIFKKVGVGTKSVNVITKQRFKSKKQKKRFKKSKNRN